MQIVDVKKYLYNNPNKIVDILEDCGCHHIRHYDNKRIQAARPDGDNASSVQVILSDTNLQTVIHTNAEYEGGDIFYLVAHLKGIENGDAIKYVYNFLGFNITYEEKETDKVFDFVDSFVRYDIKHDRYNSVENKELPDILKNQFIQAPNKMFLDEGISVKTQEDFDILYDSLSNRIIIPIYDKKGNIITFKGRATDESITPKYVAYYSFNGLDILYGYHQNLFNIIRKNEVIVFEAEKSVLKGDSLDINNTVATMRHKVSQQQIDTLIKLQVSIVWAMDKDISASEQCLFLDKFDNMVELYVMYDRNDLLDDKDSPIDKGIEVYDKLYGEKIPYKEFKDMVEKGVII